MRYPYRRLPAQNAFRFAGLGGPAHREFNPIPLPSGAPGNPVSPYDESGVWGAPVGGPTVDSPMGPLASPNAADLTGLAPFGDVNGWYNPTSLASVPINVSTSVNVPVLSLNTRRNLLLIQNNSTATAPDTTPILWIGFNAQPIAGFSLGIAAGLGITFDIICPRDSIYVLVGAFVNGGATAVVQGCVVQGTFAP